jgi:hypothetical protein
MQVSWNEYYVLSDHALISLFLWLICLKTFQQCLHVFRAPNLSKFAFECRNSRTIHFQNLSWRAAVFVFGTFIWLGLCIICKLDIQKSLSGATCLLKKNASSKNKQKEMNYKPNLYMMFSICPIKNHHIWRKMFKTQMRACEDRE